MATTPPPRINRRLLPTKEAAAYLGISRATLYVRIKAGDIETVSIGARTLIDIDDLNDYIERMKGNAS